MLLGVCVIVIIIGFILLYIGDDKYIDSIEILGVISVFIGIFAGLIMMVFVIGNHCGAGGKYEKYNETYKALCHKVESESCRDEFGLLNKEIVDEVQEWNENVVYYQRVQNDFWLGVFYPDIYDELKTIEYE